MSKIFVLLVAVMFVSVNLNVDAMGEDLRSTQRYIQQTLPKVQAEIQRWKREGKNLLEVSRVIMQFKELMAKKRFGEAKSKLEHALELVSGEAPAGRRERAKAPWKGRGVYAAYEKINIIGGPRVKNGIADPSMEYGPDGTGWLLYSYVARPYISNYLAKSTDHGKTWRFVRKINKASPETVFKGKKGHWNHETSTILYDPDDPGKEWKIFWFYYLHTKPKGKGGESLDYSMSYIAYRYASDPAGKWSEPIPILEPGYFGDKGARLSSLDRSLKDIVFVNELGSLYKDGVIYLSMEASTTATGGGERNKKRNLLFASDDHAKTWRYVGVLTDSRDARDAGYLIFTASSLVEEKGRVFLFVSPSAKVSNPRDPEGHHDGTHIFEFEDITKAKLKRDSRGKLIVFKHIDDNLLKGGQADYDEGNTYGGIVIPQQDMKYLPEMFQIFSTKEKIVD